MRILKRILLALLAILVLALVVALFVKKDYAIEKEITINKPRNEVYNYIKYLKNQGDFSKWAKMDPGMKKEYRGTDATVGFVSAWDGNSKVGKGEQEIKKMDEGNRVDYEIRFKKPMESTSTAFLATAPVSGNQTKVTWGFAGHMPYPFNIMRLFGMEKMLGDDLQTGLINLKTIEEK